MGGSNEQPKPVLSSQSTVLTVDFPVTHPAHLRGTAVLDWYTENSDPSGPVSTMAAHIKRAVVSFEEKDYEKAEELLFQDLGLFDIASVMFILDEGATAEGIGPKLEHAKFEADDDGRRLLTLPSFTVGFHAQACSVDEGLAEAIVPALLKQWLHSFQRETGVFLSSDTRAFHETGRGRAEDYDLHEVDICAFYRDLGLRIDVRRPFYKRRECCQDFRRFVANRHPAQRAYNQFCKARRKLGQIKKMSFSDLTASLGDGKSSSRKRIPPNPLVSQGAVASFKTRSLPIVRNGLDLDWSKDLDQSQRTAPTLDLSQRTEQYNYGDNLYHQFINLLDDSNRSASQDV